MDVQGYHLLFCLGGYPFLLIGIFRGYHTYYQLISEEILVMGG
jgi:hypothetical protein